MIRRPEARTLAWLRAEAILNMVDLLGKEVCASLQSPLPPSRGGGQAMGARVHVHVAAPGEQS